ncbi:MAG: hypothetical protein KGQ59_02445 [Bdellovibrionales bacterium]|nr:hypothetical protein [Bdellovibrionales bacterium]
MGVAASLISLTIAQILFWSPGHAQGALRYSGELGVIGALGSDSVVQSRARGYLDPAIDFKVTEDGFGWSARVSARGWSQFAEVQSISQTQTEAEIRDSYIGYDWQNTRVRLGFQSLSWGETFGFFIADLPNPRDLSDPLLLEIAHIKKPQFMLQAQRFFSDGGVQLYFVPLARPSDFSLAPSTESFQKVGPDSEYGFRVHRLMSFGLDGSFFLIHHHEREVIFNPSPVWSSGVTASQSMGSDWVLRTDQVLIDLKKRPLDAWRGVLGLDWNGVENVTLGGQLQRDPLNTGGSLRLTLRRTSGLLDGMEFEAFWFQGLSKSETWVQPKLSYTTKSNLKISLRYDWIEGSIFDPGLLRGLLQEDRGLLWMSYGF